MLVFIITYCDIFKSDGILKISVRLFIPESKPISYLTIFNRLAEIQRIPCISKAGLYIHGREIFDVCAGFPLLTACFHAVYYSS